MRIALMGNPNSGKSSVFNLLTGLNQKVGNFAGVTVEKKLGFCKLPNQERIEIIDLPGTYSLYAKSLDEKIAAQILLDKENELKPDAVVVVIDASNLQRNLFLFSQIQDLGYPVVLAMNMIDEAEKKGLFYDWKALEEKIGTRLVSINGRTGAGIEDLKKNLQSISPKAYTPFFQIPESENLYLKKIQNQFELPSTYWAYVYANQTGILKAEKNEKIDFLLQDTTIDKAEHQTQETLKRYEKIKEILNKILIRYDQNASKNSITLKLDKVLLHRFWGYLIFILVLLFIFQAIFTWSSLPMDMIEAAIASLNGFLQENLPESALTSLLTDGVIAGLGGILMFVPQIAILFGFIAILEETGYMARVVFLMDKIMRPFGLNGKSVVPLISGAACAIPSIMATRTIEHWKERLITIMVVPFMSCSARLPIYAIVISVIIPKEYLWGLFNWQGIVLFLMYVLGVVAALVSAWVFKILIRSTQRSFFIMELPTYKTPRWQNVGLTIFQKSQAFVSEAGKVILAVSIILWVLASYSPTDSMENWEKQTRKTYSEMPEKDLKNKIAAVKLENSYIGHLGKLIEPVFRPLGFDWKIDIAILTSFAAREVFVGTMATIYSLGADSAADQETIKSHMEKETNTLTGKPLYGKGLGFSLLIFYALAMQCMSTIAVVYKETGGWKYPILQFVYMTTVAYFLAYLAYVFWS